MRFLFDCDDEICMPIAYNLVDDIKPFIDKVREFDVDGKEAEKLDRKSALNLIFKNAMVKYPKDTSNLFAKLWVLEEGEKAPNVFKTMGELFSNEVAINFFTSVLPSLLQISKEILPR